MHFEKPPTAPLPIEDDGVASLDARRQLKKRQEAQAAFEELMGRFEDLREALWGPKPETADEAADCLVRNFAETVEAIRKIGEEADREWRETVKDNPRHDEDDEMLHEDYERFQKEKAEDGLIDCWREWVADDLKAGAIVALANRKEKDALTLISRLRNLEPLVRDVKTRTWMDENIDDWRPAVRGRRS